MSQCKSFGCINSSAFAADFCTNCLNVINGISRPTGTAEADPYGKSQHESGAKVDAGKVRMHLITGGMARAIHAVAQVGTFGAAKYTDGGWINVPDGFRRYEDAQQRHAAYRHMGEEFDPDSNLSHLAHEAWNALAKLDLYLREKETKDQAAPSALVNN